MHYLDNEVHHTSTGTGDGTIINLYLHWLDFVERGLKTSRSRWSIVEDKGLLGGISSFI